MLTTSAFRLASVQMVLFTPNHHEFEQSKMLSAILGRFTTILNGNIQALPLPMDVPMEIPRVSLQSADEQFGINGSPGRMDFIYKRGVTDLDQSIDEEFEVLYHMMEHYIVQTSSHVNRVALVQVFVSTTHDPAELLIQHFFKNQAIYEKLVPSETFILQNQQKTTIGQSHHEVNRLAKISSALLTATQEPIVAAEIDINTTVDEVQPRDYKAGDIRPVFSSLKQEAHDTLLRYFP